MEEEKTRAEDTGQKEEAKTETKDDAKEQQGKGEASENSDKESAEEEKKTIFQKLKKEDKEKAALEDRVASLSDQLKRQMAEFDNYRKRTEKEKDSMFSMGERSAIEKILPVVDNFERGFSTVEKDDENDAFVQGMHKVYDQLIKQLTDMGVTPIDCVGKDFDPKFHNAVMQAESDTLESGKVAQELQKGYMYHDQVIRHSMVSVVK